MDLHRNRTYYRKSTGTICNMVSRGGGLCVMSDGEGEQWSVTDEELDRDYSTVPGLCDAESSPMPGGDEALVRLEDKGGVSKAEVKARMGLIPGVKAKGVGKDVVSVAATGRVGRSCSICGDESGGCEHVSGEAPWMRVDAVKRKNSTAWMVVMGDGATVEVWCDEAGHGDDLLGRGEPYCSPYVGKKVHEQVKVRACAAVRSVLAGEWDGGDEVEGAPGENGDGVKSDDGEMGVDEGRLLVFPDEPWRRRADGGWEPGFQGDLCQCGERAELVRVAGGRAWYECSCGVGFTGPERGIPAGKRVKGAGTDHINVNESVRCSVAGCGSPFAYTRGGRRLCQAHYDEGGWEGHEWAPYGEVPGDEGELDGRVIVVGKPKGPVLVRGPKRWVCPACGRSHGRQRVGTGERPWRYSCSGCGYIYDSEERPHAVKKEAQARNYERWAAECRKCPRLAGAPDAEGGPGSDCYRGCGLVGHTRWMLEHHEELTMDEEKPEQVEGRLLDSHRVVNVRVNDDGWTVEFLDATVALMAYDKDDPEETRFMRATNADELEGGQARQAIKAVRAYLGGVPFVQAISVRGAHREWWVLFPHGLGCRVATSPGSNVLCVSQDDVEEWDDEMPEDDEAMLKIIERAKAAVEKWRVKHDGVKIPVDNEWEDRTDPRTAADNLGSLVRKARTELKGWVAFELPDEHRHTYSKDGVVVSDQGMVLCGVYDSDNPDCWEYDIKREAGGYTLFLAPDIVKAKAGRTIVVARNGCKLAEFVLPKVEGESPQVRGVHQGVGGWASDGPYQGRPFHDWHVRFHDGTLVWVREWLDEGDLHCPTKGKPATGGEPDNSDVEVLSKYGPIAERVVNAEIERIDETVKFVGIGMGFRVELTFGDSGRQYEWAWTTPHIPPHEGDEESWQCLTEYDPNDKSGWRERSLEILMRELRSGYHCVDADRKPGGPGNDVICWTDLGPVRCSVHPEKEPDGTGYILVDVPGGRPVDVMTRIDEAVKAHWHKPIDPVTQAELEGRLKEVSAELGARAKELYDEQCEKDEARGRQIDAAADGEGFYPVLRAPDRPNDDPERITRYNVGTEEGVMFVRASWATMGEERRVVAYDVEDAAISDFLRKRVVESVQNHIKCEHLEALGFPKTMPHDSGVLSECKCQHKDKMPTDCDHSYGRDGKCEKCDGGAPWATEGASEQRCPHDGGACHHDCKPGKCYRESAGMSLTSPHDGYPLVPEGWVCFDLLGANVGVPDDHNVYLDTIRMTPGRKMDYVFHKVAQNDWRLAVDPTVVAGHVDRGVGEALLRICHLSTTREIPSKDVHEQSAADIIHPPRGREVEVWRYKWQFHGTEAGDTVRHTDHCYKRMIHGDGECECGGRVGIKPAKLDIAYDKLGKTVDVDGPKTICTTHIFSTEPEKTKPTLEGLETRIHNMELVISEIEDGALMARVLKLERYLAQIDSKLLGKLEHVAQMDGRVQQGLKGVAAHEEWLQGLERRFAEAAVSGGDKASRALLKTVLDQARELDSRTAAQKDLGSALSKKVGEIGHLVDETRNANLRIERMVTDLGLPVAKLIEIVVGRGVQVANIAEDDDNIDILAQFRELQTLVESWQEDEDANPCDDCEHSEEGSVCDHCDGCGFVPCECECEEDEALAAKAQEVLDDPEDEAIPFDEAAAQIREQSFPVGTPVGFCGNSTMKGIVKGARKGPTGPERMVSWKDEKETTGGGWYGVDSLYELQEGEYEHLGTRASKVTSNGPEAIGVSPVVIPVSGLYMSSTTRGPVQLTKGTYSLIAGVGGEPDAALHMGQGGKALVPCGVSVLVIKDSLKTGQFVLLGKRKGAHGAGQYCFPGGRIEPEENPRECAARELEEETGIVIHPSRLQIWQHCEVNNTVTGGQPWVTLFYWVQVSNEEGKPELMEPDKCEGWDYYSTKNMPEPLFEATAECARQSGWKIPSEVDHCSD